MKKTRFTTIISALLLFVVVPAQTATLKETEQYQGNDFQSTSLPKSSLLELLKVLH